MTGALHVRASRRCAAHVLLGKLVDGRVESTRRGVQAWLVASPQIIAAFRNPRIASALLPPRAVARPRDSASKRPSGTDSDSAVADAISVGCARVNAASHGKITADSRRFQRRQRLLLDSATERNRMSRATCGQLLATHPETRAREPDTAVVYPERMVRTHEKDSRVARNQDRMERP